MKTVTRTAGKKTKSATPRKRAKKYPKNASDLAWLLDRKLPPLDQLPENPVLLMREGRL